MSHDRPRGVEDSRTVDSETEDTLLYEAESPDEAALVYAARAYNCTLRARSADSLLVDLPGVGSLPVQVLHVLPFDSNRKRMSVVVRHPLTEQVVVYTKGADSVLMDLTQTPTGNAFVCIFLFSNHESPAQPDLIRPYIHFSYLFFCLLFATLQFLFSTSVLYGD